LGVGLYGDGLEIHGAYFYFSKDNCFGFSNYRIIEYEIFIFYRMRNQKIERRELGLE
jgi:hypothetical protein